jgi:hypothetical protein
MVSRTPIEADSEAVTPGAAVRPDRNAGPDAFAG